MINWQHIWQNKGIINYLLLPLSWIFSNVVSVRRYFYLKKLSNSYQPTSPIIIIGNINVGGAGKTPFVIALSKLLSFNNIKHAVISKGYGGNYKNNLIITRSTLASESGDEPLLIKYNCDCPVIVAKTRKQAIQIIEQKFSEVQIILSDDGLQDYTIQPDMSICIINQKMQLGNQWMLPAGGLREKPQRLSSFDFVVYNGLEKEQHYYENHILGWLPATQQTLEKYGNILKKTSFFKQDESLNLAIASIAHPDLFFNGLREHHLNFKQKTFADHHPYQQKELDSSKRLLMTEKDWIKIKNLSHKNAWYLKREAIISDTLSEALLHQINLLIKSYE